MDKRVKHRCTQTHTLTYIYIFGCMYRASPPCGRTYTHGPAQASADKCAHARAHRRCRRAQPAALHSKPGRARPALVRAAGPGAAHTEAKLDTDAVFHAPMSALNADAYWNACAPKPDAVDADGQGLAHFFRVSGFRPSPQHEPANACAHSRSIPIAHSCTHTYRRPTLTCTDKWKMKV